jgi:hypothetical protein
MDRKLHLLESFFAQGSDGQRYKVMGYEHLVREPTLNDGQEHWEATGRSEYRLADGARVVVADDGQMQVASTGVLLSA